MKNLVTIKTVSSIFVIVMLVVISSVSVYASENNFLESKSETLLTPTNLDFVINYTSQQNVEDPLEIENWMINPESFLEQENEQELNWDESEMVIENWMLDVNSFVEEELQLEAWMVDVNSFLPESETELAIEPWMTNVDSFLGEEYPELAIQDWMLNVDLFLETETSAYAFK